jgi:hypothetical protein
MRRTVTIALVLAAFVAASVFGFDSDKLNKVTFKNTSGNKIQMIFLSPGDSDYWGPEIIGAQYVLKDGGTIGFYVHYPEESFTFDVMAIDEKGNKCELRGLTVSDGMEGTVALSKKNFNATAPNLTLATVNLRNATGEDLWFLFLSPSDSDAWGVDLLDEEATLADGDTFSLVIPIGKNKTKYNLMAVNEYGEEYKFNIQLDPNKTSREFNWAIEPSDLDSGN